MYLGGKYFYNLASDICHSISMLVFVMMHSVVQIL